MLRTLMIISFKRQDHAPQENFLRFIRKLFFALIKHLKFKLAAPFSTNRSTFNTILGIGPPLTTAASPMALKRKNQFHHLNKGCLIHLVDFIDIRSEVNHVVRAIQSQQPNSRESQDLQHKEQTQTISRRTHKSQRQDLTRFGLNAYVLGAINGEIYIQEDDYNSS